MKKLPVLLLLVFLALSFVQAPSACAQQLIFDDEFPGSTLNTCTSVGVPSGCKWFALNNGNHPNSQLECYVPSQDTVSGGFLTITAVNTQVACVDGNTGTGSFTGYKSGAIVWAPPSGISGFNYTFGTIEYRAKFAGGTGMWPAIWFLGHNCQPQSPLIYNDSGCNWSAQGSSENDITEIKSNNFTNPFQNSVDTAHNFHTCQPTITDVTTNYHIYDLVWTSTFYKWYVDGTLTCTESNTAYIATQAMYLIINLAVGGGGSSGCCSGFPVSNSVDYVRVYNATCAAIPCTYIPPQPPAIYFIDVTSGPGTGGENNNGTILTIYGRYFGATQQSSFVTVGGAQVAAYKTWGGVSKAATSAAQLETISVAIGSSAATGTVAVTTAVGGASICENAKDNCQFTVRSGNINCVATGGSDSNNGEFSTDPTARSGTKGCWLTMAHAIHTAGVGDITYVQNGVSQTSIDNYNAALAISAPCTSGNPCALVAYPGATATIGATSLTYGLRTPAIGGGPFSFWTIAGFNIVGQDGFDLVTVDGWRTINNDFNCPTGSGQTACMHTDTTTNYSFYGNYVHNVGDQAGLIDKFFHGIYFTTNSNHIWAAWNESNNNPTGSTTQGGCRAIQFFSTGGSNQFDLHVHDNWIHNSICDGINFSTVDPASGTVEAYNNVVWHVGTGPDPGNGSSSYSCITSGGGTATAELAYNNTFYDCGSRKTNDAGAFSPNSPPISAYNNITYELSGESYINVNATSTISGSNNIWFGLATPPAGTTGNITTDPLFNSTSTPDFTLQASSPAIGAGTAAHASTWDINGLVRPSPPSIGAYEFTAGIAAGPSPNTAPSKVMFVKAIVSQERKEFNETLAFGLFNPVACGLARKVSRTSRIYENCHGNGVDLH